jgi:hypothetical protein
LIATQTLSMLQSLALAYFALTGRATIPALLILATIQGLINAFDMPGRQSFVIDLIENKEDLGNAIALNSSMFNLARLVGPSIGGILIAAVGEGWCFYGRRDQLPGSDLRLGHDPTTPPRGCSPSEGRSHEPVMGRMAVCVQIQSDPFDSPPGPFQFDGSPYMTLVPMFAGKILHGGPHTMGFLMTAAGIGRWPGR